MDRIWKSRFIGEARWFYFFGRSDVEDVDGDVVGGFEDGYIVIDSGLEVDVGCVEFILVRKLVTRLGLVGAVWMWARTDQRKHLLSVFSMLTVARLSKFSGRGMYEEARRGL